MAFNNQGAMGGAGAGAAIGTMFAPGIGTAIGAGVGGLAGGFMNAPQVPDSSGAIQAMYKTRMNDIDSFSNQLAMARQKYLTQLPQYQNYAMGRFMPQIEANMAGRGLQVSGGAFGSALARQAGDFTQQQLLAAPETERQDLTTVENLRNGAFGSAFSPTSQAIQNQGGQQLNRGLGQWQDAQAGLGNLGFAMAQALQKPQGQVVNTGTQYGPMARGYNGLPQQPPKFTPTWPGASGGF